MLRSAAKWCKPHCRFLHALWSGANKAWVEVSPGEWETLDVVGGAFQGFHGVQNDKVQQDLNVPVITVATLERICVDRALPSGGDKSELIPVARTRRRCGGSGRRRLLTQTRG